MLNEKKVVIATHPFISRSNRNPILIPNKNHSWEAEMVFNGCPIKKGKDIFLVYRAMSLPVFFSIAKTEILVSSIGIVKSKNGVNFSKHRKWFIVPEKSWEIFGCEDPTVTRLNGKYFIFYTALSNYPFSARGIKVGLAISKDLETIEKKHLITTFNAKAMSLFSEKIDGKIWSIFSYHTDQPPTKICLASFNKEEEIWSKKYWQKWKKNVQKYSLPIKCNPKDYVKVGAQPIKTKYGWILLYSYIKNYFHFDPLKRLFSVKTILLDLKNPLKIIKEIDYPILVPEEYYEKIGYTLDVIHPSGAIIKDSFIYLYYGSADTTICLARISLSRLLDKLRGTKTLIKLKRAENNPIIVSKSENKWEAKYTLNPGAIYLNKKVHILYRALSEDKISSFGYANSKDGFNIDYRSSKPSYIPRELFEKPFKTGILSGCEDPRLTKMGDKIYMLYTAYDGKNLPRVAFTSIKIKDFLKQSWNWKKPVLISPPYRDDKDACLFPEKIKGRYLFIHRIGNDIDFSFSETLNFDGKTWLDENRWILQRRGMWDSLKLGICGPPTKTKAGWILFYHGVSEDDGAYRIGAVLLDLKNPLKVIARTIEPIFEPETDYEKRGWVSNVVFPCGEVLIKDKIFVYYGGADKVIGVATISLKDLLKILFLNKV